MISISRPGSSRSFLQALRIRAMFRPALSILAGLVCTMLLLPTPQASAANKDIIELQTEVQQLQSMLLTIQQSQEEHMGVLTNMVQQTASSVTKISTQLDAMQKSVQTVQDASSGKLDQVSGQMQSLNDSVDELRARLDKLQKSLDTLQQQQQSLQAGQASQMSGSGAPATGVTPGVGPEAGSEAGSSGSSTQPPSPQAPPVTQLYQSALSDYNAAKYNLASQEFGDVLKDYPQNDLAGNAQFYQAEIAYRQGDYQNALQGYNALLLQYPGSNKAPAAMLRKGQSLLVLGQRDAALHELRALIQRYPKTPEAVQARNKLDTLATHPPAKPQAGHSF